MRIKPKAFKSSLLVIGILSSISASSHAALVVYEGFQYSNVGDPLDGFTSVDAEPTGLSGTGAGTWADASNSQEMFLKSGSLNFSNLPTSGNHIGFSSNSSNDIFNRGITADLDATGSLYFSFLFEKLQNNFGADREGFAVFNQTAPSSRWDSGNPGALGLHGFAVASVDSSNLKAVLYDGTTGTRIVSTSSVPISVVNGGSNTSTSNAEVNLIVGEISFNTGTGGADVFKLYNAVDDGSLDAGDLTLIDTIEGDMDETLLSTLNLTRQVNVNYDEVRIGTTLDDVLGIPEPSTALLGALGALLLLRRRSA